MSFFFKKDCMTVMKTKRNYTIPRS